MRMNEERKGVSRISGARASRGQAIRSSRQCNAIGGQKCSEMGSCGRGTRRARWHDGSRMLPKSNQCLGANAPRILGIEKDLERLKRALEAKDS
ncbi:hypothetical protein PIB30_087161 [Stylosanthes scabra]|uniref:Uncharacterized protein n=1 Tax=Stylosanthes scabra TaxID=79078 RepID=A0ABU6XV39_9FABA|nr:hypothetical protein [Stylosanthes scabra]